jgi:hypothetical protein
VIGALLVAGADPRDVQDAKHINETASNLIEEAVRLRERDGERVIVSGVTARPELNGCLGTICGNWIGRGRCRILINGEHISLKQSAVRPAHRDGADELADDVNDGGSNKLARVGGLTGETTGVERCGVGGDSDPTRASINGVALIAACLDGNSAKIISCLEESASVHTFGLYEKLGIYPLHAAVMACRANRCQGRLPLDESNELTCVQLLLDAKACPNQMSSDTITAGKLAIDYKLPHILRALIQAGAEMGPEEIGAAAISSSPDCLDVLLEADISTDLVISKPDQARSSTCVSL